MMLMGMLGVTDKFPWDVCFASNGKKSDADDTAASHSHAGHSHAGHDHSH